MPDQSKPLSREPEVEDLIKNFITPVGQGYDRNHSTHPVQLNASTHRVKINGQVTRPIELSISELRNEFAQHEVVCALQCAGNRRHVMRTKIKEVDGVDWLEGAVMNCKWRGPLLADVLERAGVKIDQQDRGNAHVAFASCEVECDDAAWYGASIPLSRALRRDAEVVLALDMNDQPLSLGHGFPVRVVTPGIAGARSVKWSNQVTVQMQESENHCQHFDDKVLPPEVTSMEQAKEVWETIPAVQEMPVNPVIAWPQSGSAVRRDADGTVSVAGYALPGGEDGPVVKVEVTADGGKSWREAELIAHPEESKWSWKLWQALTKNTHTWMIHSWGKVSTTEALAQDRPCWTQGIPNLKATTQAPTHRELLQARKQGRASFRDKKQ
ncbi:Sulfite oxidase, mitochondrial [Fulvia fulva]|uniref:Sulfite oxidase, mitochondrial n=1 Tax=Passalora fulva TaxID=5499 RepID=A0A9Q8PBN2_PASFU|nr:Sulfite oxidase, mitochondrial [Fulvia fulva]KAK4621421.1 Sulfite oxidase, mitochondrial [Fulvia fulva]KAK4622774.1 Sulfite oxidase, mitochondrial [Fulvia fulva]UJO19455.1 Sulfite oxidase, mitochondrial [Fulvia fulva]WPV15856.1 Sulfite oxidase, mitochondrial [Fulvia fulva]WPV31397.1 Sulfite oxidase, mitochondrial [Fulvia fulva]